MNQMSFALSVAGAVRLLLKTKENQSYRRRNRPIGPAVLVESNQNLLLI